jgi:hypothetical protein
LVVIIVQEIIATWTKRARGGKAATKRNALPEAVLIPSTVAITYPFALVHDKVSFYEETHHHMTVDEFTTQQKYHYGCLSIAWDDSAISATFAYTRNCGGAPERTAYPRKVLTLPLGTWGRVLYNGRFSEAEGHWIYHKTVLNIGHFDTLANDIFLTTPYRVFAEMADLS